MSYSLVGFVGPVSVGAPGVAVTPGYGTGSNRDKGNLLVWLSIGMGTGALLTQRAAGPAWLSQGNSLPGDKAAFLLGWRIATGGDTAPTVNGSSSAVIASQLMEFSGNHQGGASSRDGSLIDKAAINSASPVVATAFTLMEAPGELVVYMGEVQSPTPQLQTLSVQVNNGGLPNDSTNNGISDDKHYCFGYSIVPSNGALDSVTFNFSTSVPISFNPHVDFQVFRLPLPVRAQVRVAPRQFSFRRSVSGVALMTLPITSTTAIVAQQKPLLRPRRSLSKIAVTTPVQPATGEQIARQKRPVKRAQSKAQIAVAFVAGKASTSRKAQQKPSLKRRQSVARRAGVGLPLGVASTRNKAQQKPSLKRAQSKTRIALPTPTAGSRQTVAKPKGKVTILPPRSRVAPQTPTFKSTSNQAIQKRKVKAPPPVSQVAQATPTTPATPATARKPRPRLISPKPQSAVASVRSIPATSSAFVTYPMPRKPLKSQSQVNPSLAVAPISAAAAQKPKLKSPKTTSRALPFIPIIEGCLTTDEQPVASLSIIDQGLELLVIDERFIDQLAITESTVEGLVGADYLLDPLAIDEAFKTVLLSADSLPSLVIGDALQESLLTADWPTLTNTLEDKTVIDLFGSDALVTTLTINEDRCP